MKLIFLEIHGVLMLPIREMIATLNQIPVTAYKPTIEALNYITDKTCAEIVVTSAWRNAGGTEVMRDKLEEWGAKGRVQNITPIGEGKEEEITRYLIWASIPEAYVVIDQQEMHNTGYAELSKYSVRTDPEHGLTMEMAQRAVQILQGKP